MANGQENVLLKWFAGLGSAVFVAGFLYTIFTSTHLREVHKFFVLTLLIMLGLVLYIELSVKKQVVK